MEKKEIKEVVEKVKEIKKEIRKIFLGHEKVVNSLIRAILCDGHVLIEGIPGIAKTLLIKSLARTSGCSVNRIQFTVDLLPSDIIGLTTYDTHKGFEILKGPIFANFVIADEINRSPPKTQSALIEAMQEKQVTIGKETFHLPSPFFVMASQNPIENEGVYPLPEAQIDRFLFKVVFSYPEEDEEEIIMERNINFIKFEDLDLKKVISPKKIIEMQELVHKIYIDKKLKKYILQIVKKTREKTKYGKYIELGASPRATIALFISSKAEALMNGRSYVIPSDVKNVAPDILRHRLILSYNARAEGMTAERIIEKIINETEVV